MYFTLSLPALTILFTNAKRFLSAASTAFFICAGRYLPAHKEPSDLCRFNAAAAFTTSLCRPSCPVEVEIVLITGQPSFSDRIFVVDLCLLLLIDIALVQCDNYRNPKFQKLCGEKQASAQIRSIHDIDDRIRILIS